MLCFSMCVAHCLCWCASHTLICMLLVSTHESCQVYITRLGVSQLCDTMLQDHPCCERAGAMQVAFSVCHVRCIDGCNAQHTSCTVYHYTRSKHLHAARHGNAVVSVPPTNQSTNLIPQPTCSRQCCSLFNQPTNQPINPCAELSYNTEVVPDMLHCK